MARLRRRKEGYARRSRPSPELHPGPNLSRGHIPRVDTHGSGESLFGRRFHLPQRDTGDLFRYAVVIAAAILLNAVVLVSLSWFGLKDLIASLPNLFFVFLVALPIGFLLVLAHFLVRGRRRDPEEKPVFLIGFAVLVGGWLLYRMVWFLIEVFRQS